MMRNRSVAFSESIASQRLEPAAPQSFDGLTRASISPALTPGMSDNQPSGNRRPGLLSVQSGPALMKSLNARTEAAAYALVRRNGRGVAALPFELAAHAGRPLAATSLAGPTGAVTRPARRAGAGRVSKYRGLAGRLISGRPSSARLSHAPVRQDRAISSLC